MYTILTKQKWHPRSPSNLHIGNIPEESIYAIDIETTGLDPKADRIVGVSIAGQFGNCYLDTREDKDLVPVLEWLAKHSWKAFNSVFDGSFIIEAQHRLMGTPYHELTTQVCGDTMVEWKLFANEGWPLHRFNLATAINNLLGWEGSQKNTLEELLVKHSLKKNEMGKLADLEPEAFALYGAMDAEACYQLHCLLGGYLEAWPAVAESYECYKVLIQLVIEQKLRGVTIDLEALTQLSKELQNSMDSLEFQFRNHVDVKPFLSAFEIEEAEQSNIQHTVKQVRAKLSDSPWLGGWSRVDKPAKASWEKEHGVWERPVVSTKIVKKKIKSKRFNVQSKAHLRELFFNHLQYAPVEHTPTGLGKIDKKLLSKLGKPGELLAQYNRDLKLLGYVTRVLERSPKGLLHYDLAVHGTVTGRSAGRGGINIQQLAKDERYLRCFVARKGYSLIDTDFTSLENVVLAEASRDKGLMELYASGKPHDSYLFVACFVFPDSGVAEVYCPDNPTKDSVAAAKKQFKKLRDICKVLVLSSNYGAGVGKIHATLTQSGVDISFEEVSVLHKKFWELFAGIKKFQTSLERELEAREGYILNGLGRPICVIPDFLKDIVNKYCQSTGVGLLHLLLKYIDQLRRDRKIPMYPWICDFHDQTSWEVLAGYEEEAKQIFAEAYLLLNQHQSPTIPIKGDIDIGETLWEFKAG